MILLAIASTAGLTIEFYSFVVYGYAAALVFPKLIFPHVPPSLGTVLAFLTFAAGFPARIIGAFVFGHFGDKISRRVAFTWDLVITGAATALIGLLPPASVIGYATAPILLTLLRFFQGFGLGGEFGGATALLAEFGARRKYRAFWVGFANAGFPIGGALGALALLIPNFSTTGWRIAFLLSLVIAIPAIITRYIIAESPMFMEILRRKLTERAPSITVFKRYWAPIILLALLSAFQQFDGYTSLTYIVRLMNQLGYSTIIITLTLVVGRVFDFLGVPINGFLARFMRRRTEAIITILITTALSYPYVLALLSRNLAFVLLMQALIVLWGVGILHAFAPTWASEQFPTKYRYSGPGIAYETAAFIGGAFTPAILESLIRNQVERALYIIPGFYAIYAVIAIIAALLLRETKDINLEMLDKE